MLDLVLHNEEVKKENRVKALLKDENGLSLVELLAVVVILVIISGIGVLGIGRIIQNSREDARVADIQQAFNAAVLYRSSNPTLGEGQTTPTQFSLADLKEAGLYESTAGWQKDKLTSVKFTIQSNGTMTINVPAGALKAGQKTSKALVASATSGTTTSTTSELTQSDVNNLTRGNLF